jgi:hypothetical protein
MEVAPLLPVGKHVGNVNLPVPRDLPGLGDQGSRPPRLVLHLARLSMVRESLFRLSSFEMTLHADYSTPNSQRLMLPVTSLLKAHRSSNFLKSTLQTPAARKARVHHCSFIALSSPCENINLLISRLSVEITIELKRNIKTSRL